MRYWQFTEDGIEIEPNTIQPGMTKGISPVTLSSMDYQHLHDKLYDIRFRLENLNSYLAPDKFKELINYRTEVYHKMGFDKIARMIEIRCGNYLGIMKSNGKFLYRGVKPNESDGKTFFMGNSRTDRRPKDSESAAQDIWNKALAELNIFANRSNSIFTTSSLNQANGFGDLYMIFPFDTAKFSWSKTHRDIILSYYDLSTVYTINLGNYDKSKLMIYSDDVQKIYNNLKSKKMEDNKSINLITCVSEILYFLKSGLTNMDLKYFSECVKFIDRMESDNNISEFFIELRDFLRTIISQYTFDMDKFQKKYQVTDKDFGKALEGRNEICISGHYIAIDEKYREYFANLWMGER